MASTAAAVACSSPARTATAGWWTGALCTDLDTCRAAPLDQPLQRSRIFGADEEVAIGRPLKDINPTTVERLAAIGCNADEIGPALGASGETIRRRFGPELEKGATRLKISVRRMQYLSAKKGNVVMQIWLGKNLLGQRDAPPPAPVSVTVNLEGLKGRAPEIPQPATEATESAP